MSLSDTDAPLVLFAPGAGASTGSAWIQGFRRKLMAFVEVVCFDYEYQRAGRRSPDRFSVLLDAHRQAFYAARASRPDRPIILVGKSMGGRVGCHLSVELGAAGPRAVVCLGYPLVGQNGALRDQVLRELSVPVLFVQGTRDKLCPLQKLAELRSQMQAPSELYVVPGGDHSLLLTRTLLRATSTTQDSIDSKIINHISGFFAGLGMFHSGNIAAQLRKDPNG